MAIAIGGNSVNKAYLGATEIQKMYLGSELVFGGTTPPVGITPILTNFNVIDAEKSRVYFDTPLGYPDGMTITGFFINGKTITGVTKVSDTQGYFTVSSPFTFWEKAYTIRLGEITDTSHRQSALYNFSMESIDNYIAEPDANTNKYMSPDGSGTHSGDSEANAWGMVDIYGAGTISAGTTVWMKAGTYDTYNSGREAYLYFLDDGSIDNPIKFIGYKNTPGDMAIRFVDDFVYTTAAEAEAYFDPTEYPVIESNIANTARGIRTPNGYVIFKNIGIKGLKTGVGDLNNNQHYENIISGASGQGGDGTGDGWQIGIDDAYINLKDCIGFDYNMTCIQLQGEYNFVDNCRAYGGNASPSPDYTLVMRDCAYSVIKNSLAQEFEGSNNIGHGIGIKASGNWENTGGAAVHNLIVDNRVLVNGDHENLFIRRKSVQYCVAKRNYSENGYSLARPGNGSQFNLWEYNYAKNCNVFIGISGNGESDPWIIPAPGESIQSNGNIIRNNIATSVNRVIEAFVTGVHSEGDNVAFLNTNNQIYNNTIDGLGDEFIYTRLDDADNGQTGWSYDFSGTEFKNNIFVLGTGNTSNFYFNSLVNDNSFIWDSNNWTEKPASWTLPTNETNRTELNPNFVNEADYVPQTELDCPVLFGAELDYSENERANPTTKGGVKGLNEGGGVTPPPSGGFPMYEDSGTLAASVTSTLSVNYPTTVNTNDILVIRVFQAANATFTTPVGWDVIGTEASTDASYVAYWKRISTSESGSVNIISNAGSLPFFGRMDRFSGCVTSGTPYESYTTTGWALSFGETFSNSGTASVDDSLAVCWYQHEDDRPLTNGSVGYSEEYLVNSGEGSDGTLALLTEEIALIGGSDGSVLYTTDTSEFNASFGIIFIPE